MRNVSTGLVFSCLLAALSSGCALVGTVRPVDQKSQTYRYMDLSKTNPDWIRLPADAAAPAGDDEVETTEISDVAFQSKSTAAIISLNSACRKHPETEVKSLHDLTNLLILGLTNITLREERGRDVLGVPALETTVQGSMPTDDEERDSSRKQPKKVPMTLQTVVLRRGACVYDMVYLSKPEYFGQHQPDFSQFIDSLKL